jgi:hypothetical protein
MCTCIVSLTAQVRLIRSWCMKIRLRRAAYISATDEQTEIDMEINIAVNTGDKSVYIYGPSGLEKISQSISLRSIQSNK